MDWKGQEWMWSGWHGNPNTRCIGHWWSWMNFLGYTSIKELILFSFFLILLLHYQISPHPIHYPVLQVSQNFFLANLANGMWGNGGIGWLKEGGNGWMDTWIDGWIIVMAHVIPLWPQCPAEIFDANRVLNKQWLNGWRNKMINKSQFISKTNKQSWILWISWWRDYKLWIRENIYISHNGLQNKNLRTIFG